MLTTIKLENAIDEFEPPSPGFISPLAILPAGTPSHCAGLKVIRKGWKRAEWQQVRNGEKRERKGTCVLEQTILSFSIFCTI